MIKRILPTLAAGVDSRYGRFMQIDSDGADESIRGQARNKKYLERLQP